MLYLAGVTGYSPAATVRLVHRRDAAPQALWFFSLAPALTILLDPLRAFAPNAPVHPLAGTPAVALLPSSSAAKDRVPCPLPVDPGLPALPKPLLPEPSRYALQSPAACPATSAPVAFSSLFREACRKPSPRLLGEPAPLSIRQPRCRRFNALGQQRLHERGLALGFDQLFLQRKLLARLPAQWWSAIALAKAGDEEADLSLSYGLPCCRRSSIQAAA